jgi:class 3 adenylate cyclase
VNSLVNDDSRYEDFPIIGYAAKDSAASAHFWDEVSEVSFSGHEQNCCICFIDMMNSTKISSELGSAEITRYYAIFLNAMATIVKNFGAKIIKNAGDCLIYYFPKTFDPYNQSSFKDVLECGITMISAHQAINAKLHEEKLPSLNYRISADYGAVQFAKSASSQSDDLFGSTVNLCAKINSKASPNGMVIGNDLYQIAKAFDYYIFEEVGGYATGFNQKYSVYSVTSKHKRNILNPFKRTTEFESG